MTNPSDVTSCSSSSRGCQVKEDVAEGWEGFCMGLQLINRSSTQEACRAACCSDPVCEVWQLATQRSNRGTNMSCYTGKGFECRSVRTDDFLILAGQRISHGSTLGNGVWCTGNGMRKVPYSTSLSHRERTDECRSGCFFDKDCHVWQYSTVKGCWSGSPKYGSIKCYQDISLAGSIMDGQKFDRSCESTVKPETDYIMVFLVILSAAFLLCCFGAVVMCFGFCAAKKIQTPLSSRSKSPRSRRQGGIDEERSDSTLGMLPSEDLSRAGAPGGEYRALYPNTGSSMGSMSESGSMVAPPYGPLDKSFGGVSSNSSFGQGIAPLLPQPQYPQMLQMQPGMVQPRSGSVQMMPMQVYPGMPMYGAQMPRR